MVFTSSAEEIVKTFVKFDARIVFSAEEACWPDASLMVCVVLMTLVLCLLNVLKVSD